MSRMTELIVLRHAPALADGCLAGRRDVPACLPGAEVLASLRAAVGRVDAVVTSPLLRCRQTAAALWPAATPRQVTDLREQDFGDWEGRAHADLPDLGPLPPAALAAHAAPGGESFLDLCARMTPALEALGRKGGRIALVAHAGTVRAALARATGYAPGALAFQVAPLSLSRFLILPSGDWVVAEVNRLTGAEA